MDSNYRIGFGSDIHRLVEGRPLIIGGIRIPSDTGAEGHSDADALLHAITDAILGALALGDIGSHFPDSEARWKDADSRTFLTEAANQMLKLGFRIANLDSVVHLETPKLRPHVEAMRKNIAMMLEIESDLVSIKAKTSEGFGMVGKGLAIKAEVVILVVNVR